MEIDKEMLKGYIDTILMSLIKDSPMYGYELAKRVRDISEETFELKEGTLYLSLKRLEKNGYVKSYWEDSESGGGRRKYYSITEEGISYILKKNQQWIFMRNLIDKFMEGIDDGK
ncbi:PadR family transcriptional regulator [Clostridium cellulovorans]|uniref:Transcriptional regulator, PadR-like family n=1 Tax=Clostridium cellulovorans (strain ATCC 35296 / DSM 3052 / OCM 3 / 743B) TaxID=573061 RepID=D9SKU4_CLOC7|nr:PadR family transcriptional regulator [Clostridium cellulovorans]ADL53516.1 transcriptional regulator, PadR-like family [Clostridium cellulovorans 743B]